MRLWPSQANRLAGVVWIRGVEVERIVCKDARLLCKRKHDGEFATRRIGKSDSTPMVKDACRGHIFLLLLLLLLYRDAVPFGVSRGHLMSRCMRKYVNFWGKDHKGSSLRRLHGYESLTSLVPISPCTMLIF
jgi:hypothetical protein